MEWNDVTTGGNARRYAHHQSLWRRAQNARALRHYCQWFPLYLLTRGDSSRFCTPREWVFGHLPYRLSALVWRYVDFCWPQSHRCAYLHLLHGDSLQRDSTTKRFVARCLRYPQGYGFDGTREQDSFGWESDSRTRTPRENWSSHRLHCIQKCDLCLWTSRGRGWCSSDRRTNGDSWGGFHGETWSNDSPRGTKRQR